MATPTAREMFVLLRLNDVVSHREMVNAENLILYKFFIDDLEVTSEVYALHREKIIREVWGKLVLR